MATSDIYAPDAIDANRRGTFTDAQRRNLSERDRGIRWDQLTFAGIALVIGLLLLTSTGPAPNAAFRPLVGTGCLVLAGFLVLRWRGLGDTFSSDIREGRVTTVEGALMKRRVNTGTSSAGEIHYLDVAGHSYEVGSAVYAAAPDAGIVRLYILPRTHKVVNFERLPDRPLPAGALESPTDALRDIGRQMRSHDETDRAEARAEMAALGGSVRAQFAAAAVPPPPAERDPRPLQESIIGSWRRGPMAIRFDADGVVHADMGGSNRSGRWKIDGDGRLHADALGHDQAAEAWVSGDTLTISADGMGMTFERVTA
jgi:hypothetical protein